MDLLIYGISGHMGRLIEEAAKKDENFDNIYGISEDRIEVEPSSLYDVIIDFSHPSSLDGVINLAKKNKIPLVIGTTGYSEEQLSRIEELSKEIPILKTTNMSLGMNILFSLVEKMAAILKDTVDIEVLESHHNRKVDAPSGSAKTIVKSIEKGLGEERKHQYGRSGESKREEGEIGIHSIRAGNIVGFHEASFINELETVKISHEAYDRSVFASGALVAAKFVINKDPGIYTMKDVLNM